MCISTLLINLQAFSKLLQISKHKKFQKLIKKAFPSLIFH